MDRAVPAHAGTIRSRASSGSADASSENTRLFEKRQHKCCCQGAHGVGADPVSVQRGRSTERKTKHMDVTINENEIIVPAEIATWGDLLDWIETDCLKAGQCITHVYLDGNEACNY